VSSEATEESVELSIGEVLELLQEEFPDVTISKIRFLESQGLIQPGRTASGYRRFNGPDVGRLRWILHQQRDNFLPLKVIRQMLDEGVDRFVELHPEQPTLWEPQDLHGVEISAEQTDELNDGGERVTSTGSGVGAQRSDRSSAPLTGPRTGSTADTEPASSPQAPVTPTRRRPLETPADLVAVLQEDPRPLRSSARRRAPLWTDRPEGDQPTMTVDELCDAARVGLDLLADLERFGLVRPAQRAGETFYGHSALEVATLAGRAATHGISARHLRMYLVSAEREAGVIEQLTLPLLKQRNPESKRAAVELSGELAGIGADLHAALLRRELGPVLGEAT